MPIVIIAVIVVVGIAVAVFTFTRPADTGRVAESPTGSEMIEDRGGTDAAVGAGETSMVTTIEDVPPLSTMMGEYADGSYRAVATYFTPRNVEHEIEVALTVVDDVITSAEVRYDGSATPATPNHTRFDGAYSGEVVGVALGDVSLSRTGGASLTSDAFNEAVDTIKAEARS